MLRLRLRLAEAVLSVDKDDARVTARIGISSCQRAETKGEHVLQLADDALYAAKVAGPLNRGRPDLICAKHGRRRSAARASISETIRAWRVNEPVRSR